jgi:hypothetical protein
MVPSGCADDLAAQITAVGGPTEEDYGARRRRDRPADYATGVPRIG